MTKKLKEKSIRAGDSANLPASSRELMSELFAISGSEALNRILEYDDPKPLIQNLAKVDFLWLIKKIGETDSLPILKIASAEQWQYMLDMEIWQRDRLDLNQISTWLDRFQQADPERLIRWLYSDGQYLTYYYFFKTIQVEIKEGDEVYDLPDDFFTLDNLYYIRILDKEHEEIIENILRKMAQEDYERYQALLLGLVGVLPVEAEENMHRMRNVRLAEDGFLPYDEAISIYSHLNADSLQESGSEYKAYDISVDDTLELVPFTHLDHAMGNDLLAKCFSRITDNRFLDRIRLEFAGLCNQILSADSLRVDDIKVLVNVCRKAAGYINIGLERLSADDIDSSEQYLKKNPLISFFRVGFGVALELRWEAERWIKDAWFIREGLKPDFWGDEWDGVLVGILQKRPCFYVGFQEGTTYRGFEKLSEIEDCRIILHHIIVLDRLLNILTAKHHLDRDRVKDPFLTFYPLLFNLWARVRLKLDPGFSSLSLDQVRDFFKLLRSKGQRPPYRMPGFKKTFIRDIMSYATDFEHDTANRLKETLSLIWEKFVEEYSWVGTTDIDERYTKFIITKPSS
ncbi:MAG: DUF6178 family protein [Thermodesulfobacteriota bacterium]|nr:DUF6178 family protein [Thermodesulfobacteriota bacterium]